MSYSNVDKIMEQIKEEKFDIDDIQHLMQELRMLLAEMEDDNEFDIDAQLAAEEKQYNKDADNAEEVRDDEV